MGAGFAPVDTGAVDICLRAGVENFAATTLLAGAANSLRAALRKNLLKRELGACVMAVQDKAATMHFHDPRHNAGFGKDTDRK